MSETGIPEGLTGNRREAARVKTGYEMAQMMPDYLEHWLNKRLEAVKYQKMIDSWFHLTL